MSQMSLNVNRESFHVVILRKGNDHMDSLGKTDKENDHMDFEGEFIQREDHTNS